MTLQILWLILITFVPFIELRLAIPLGILAGSVNFPFGLILQGFGMSPFVVVPIVLVTNILLGMVLFLIFEWIGKEALHRPRYQKFVEKRKRKIKRYVDKFGILGVALFIGIPLPGSGVYTGSLGSFLIGMKRKDYFLANLIGVLIAGAAVTIITLITQKVF